MSLPVQRPQLLVLLLVPLLMAAAIALRAVD
jgi:hypothetical protein